MKSVIEDMPNQYLNKHAVDQIVKGLSSRHDLENLKMKIS